MIENYAQFHNDGGFHMEDEVNLSMNTSDSDSQTKDSKFITLQQVSALIPKVNEGDGDIDQYVLKHSIFLMEHKVRRVNKYLDTIYSFWKDIKPMEMIVAFDESNGDIDELTINLLKPEFKQMIRDLVKKKLSDPYTTNSSTPQQSQDDDDAFDGNDDDADDDEFYEPVQVEEVIRPYHHRHSKSKPISHENIPPAPKGVNPETWLSWSDARRNSYLRADSFPNAYYYRHLPPGEKQINGAWTAQEKANFLKRVEEFRGDSDTINGDWGLFSLTIPGRVGYQCSNFYRKLVEAGEIYDSRYIKGEDGNIHHTSRMHDGKIVTKTSSKSGRKSTKQSGKRVIEPSKIRSLRLVFNDTEHPEPPKLTKITSAEFVSQQNELRQQKIENTLQMKSRYDVWSLQNPLPNMIDDITGEVIRVPAISPDGYVLDYNTWLNVLKTKKENPFTRTPVTKRQLVVLTTENFEEYEKSIVNLNSNEETSPAEE